MGQTSTGTIGSANNIIVDHTSIIRSNGHKVWWPGVPERFRTGAIKVQLNGAAAQGATSLTVDALPGPVRYGAILDFGGALFARVRAEAAAGATAVLVDAIPTLIPDNSVAWHAAPGTPRTLPAGIAVGKAGSPNGVEIYPRIVTTNPAFGLLLEDIVEGITTSGPTGHAVAEGGYFWENRLPDALDNGGTLPSAIKTELGARFLYRMAGNNAATL